MPSTSLTRYRRAVISDLEQLVDFQIALGLESENLTIDAVPCRAGLIVVFDRPQLGWYYVAERDARVVGCLSVAPEYIDWRGKIDWWIHSVYVEPAHRGTRVLAGLFAHVRLEAMADTAVRGTRLYVHTTNMRAKRAYKRLGMAKEPYELYEWIKPSSNGAFLSGPAQGADRSSPTYLR